LAVSHSKKSNSNNNNIENGFIYIENSSGKLIRKLGNEAGVLKRNFSLNYYKRWDPIAIYWYLL
jgi:hypothetical protein